MTTATSIQLTRGTLLQVAHVVRDLDAAVARWVHDFGAGPFFVAQFNFGEQVYRGQAARVHVTVALGCLGSTLIELARPDDSEPSIFNEVLERRGEGLHHYWLHCDDFDGEIARYTAAGCPLVAHGPIPGIGRGAYMDTTTLLGCYVELLELRPELWRVLDTIRAAHLNWDGSEPMRAYPKF
jgi:hypothetical protein